MNNPITNSEDVIDSRDILDRIDNLAGDESRTDEQDRELASLRRVEEQAHTYGDWRYGEALIRQSYFVAYTRELIADCYPEIEKALSESTWPARHMTIDYAAAARELEQDYTEIDFDGVPYLMRA